MEEGGIAPVVLLLPSVSLGKPFLRCCWGTDLVSCLRRFEQAAASIPSDCGAHKTLLQVR
jgi:hypothetical protein